MKPCRRRPTGVELAILRLLWSRGPRTVGEVGAAKGRESADTTTLKLLQIRRLVRRHESSRRDLLEGVLAGSAATPVAQALANLE
jgi:BlaI family penicillinase repressor